MNIPETTLKDCYEVLIRWTEGDTLLIRASRRSFTISSENGVITTTNTGIKPALLTGAILIDVVRAISPEDIDIFNIAQVLDKVFQVTAKRPTIEPFTTVVHGEDLDVVMEAVAGIVRSAVDQLDLPELPADLDSKLAEAITTLRLNIGAEEARLSYLSSRM